MPFALGDDGLRIICVPHQHQHAIVMRATIDNALHVMQQLFIVALIGFRLSRVTCGKNARRATQCRDADSGIIRQRGLPAQPADMARLGQRILDERHMRLFGLTDAELRLGQHFDAEGAEHVLEFAQFAGVVGGDD